MSEALLGKNAIVTGGTRGIGLAIAKEFLKEGASVSIWGVSEEAGKKSAQELSSIASQGKIFFNKIDVSDSYAVKQGVEDFMKEFGSIDILVNNAGITRDALLMKLSEEDWEKVLRVNLFSAYYTCSGVIRYMMKARKGKIINISSVVGLHGSPGQTNYAASKAGLIGFSKALAKEVASRNINVNCIAPGFIGTDMTKVLKQELLDHWLELIPMKRMGSPEEIAKAALFLASSSSNYVTGQVLSVDGGLSD